MVNSFKIATWNVNSLRIRLPHVLNWLAHHQPDIIALQETKIPDENFPSQAFQVIGYHALFSGQKAYNGVALLSRFPAQEVISYLPGLEDDPQRRIMIATYGTLKVVNVYVPNGEKVGSEKYIYKINWLNYLYHYLQEMLVHAPHGVILGDFNIAPENEDVHHPATWEGHLLVSALERTALKNICSLGLHDAFRLFAQLPNSFSWWDYRGKAFQRHHGARIDLILVSTSLLSSCTSCVIDSVPRTLERPSDHAPVIATFSLNPSWA